MNTCFRKINFLRTMSYVRVPPGLTRINKGTRVIYQSNPPGLRVKIYGVRDFDEMKLRGRFAHIDRGQLNFSTKIANEPEEHMEVDLPVGGGEHALPKPVEDAVASKTLELTTAAQPQLLNTRQAPTHTPKPENRIRDQVCNQKRSIMQQ